MRFFKNIKHFIKLSSREISALLNSMFSSIKFSTTTFGSIFSKIRDEASKNKYLLGKYSFNTFVTILVWMAFDYTVRYFAWFDINQLYDFLLEIFIRASASLDYTLFISYRYVRWYFLKSLNYIWGDSYFILNVYMDNFNFFKKEFLQDAAAEETGFAFFLYLTAHIFYFYFLTYLYSLFDKKIPSKDKNITTLEKNSTLKKFYIFNKFVYMLFNRISLGITWFFIQLKKIYIFIRHFSFNPLISFLKSIFNKVANKFLLLWKPVFKKWSYYGIFRSYRSKWLKK